ncbi:hypothetical protein BXU11_17670 [Flavobacterium sp. LM5]|nr:hypothetical protein BXU11_17670 [Flavobacterium sp. LM5]
MRPLAFSFVFPMPLSSRFGISRQFNLPETTLFRIKMSFGLLSNGLVFANCGASSNTSLKPNLLLLMLALILISFGFLAT